MSDSNVISLPHKQATDPAEPVNTAVKFGQLAFLYCPVDEKVDMYDPANWTPCPPDEVPEVIKAPAIVTQMLAGFCATSAPTEDDPPEFWWRAVDITEDETDGPDATA